MKAGRYGRIVGSRLLKKKATTVIVAFFISSPYSEEYIPESKNAPSTYVAGILIL